MPGHGIVFPVAMASSGGARGRLQRSKVSTMTMRPPQHGHGGRMSSGSTIASSTSRGAAPSSSRIAMQAAHLLQWWRRIETQLQAMKPRECYQPPFAIKEDTELKKIALDFQTAGKKLKKAERRR